MARSDNDFEASADASPMSDEAGIDDPAAHGFDTDPMHEKLAVAGELARRPFAWLAAVGSALVWPVEAGVAFFFAFREAGLRQAPDRRLVDLLQAVPAAVVAAGVIGIAVAGVIEAGGREAEYQAAAAGAAERGDDEGVRVFAGRVYDLTGTPGSLFRFGEAEERLGHAEAAESVMTRLAEAEDYGPAHFWLAERSAGDPASFRDADAVGRLASRLRQAEAAGGVEEARLAPLMAQALLAGGDVAGAIPYLERAAATDGRLQLDLASAYARVGRNEDARAAAVAAEPVLRARVEAAPEDRTARAGWVTCLLNLGRPGDAVAALEGQCRDGALGDLFVLACLASEREGATGGAPLEERLGWIKRALEVRPRAEPALLRLIELAGDPAAGAEAAKLLDESVAGGEVTPTVSVALGTRAWQAGDEAAALGHLERAYAVDPTNVVAANNVAWLLARRSPGDQERALVIANELVAKFPEAAQFRDTRGQVLAKLGRWDEALVDLERALSAMRDSVETRRVIAEAYRRAGQAGLAERHEREADRLEAEAAAKKARSSGS